jgi:hypothetical protein
MQKLQHDTFGGISYFHTEFISIRVEERNFLCKLNGVLTLFIVIQPIMKIEMIIYVFYVRLQELFYDIHDIKTEREVILMNLFVRGVDGRFFIMLLANLRVFIVFRGFRFKSN